MINFETQDKKIQCAILAQITKFNKRNYSQPEMDQGIQEFRKQYGEEAVQELTKCYEQFVFGLVKNS